MRYNWIFFGIIFSLLLLSCEDDEGTSKPKEEEDTPKEEEEDEFVIDENKTFVHPGLLHSQEDFERIKLKVSSGEEPWISGWNALIENTHSHLSYNPSPTIKLIRGGSSREEPESDNYSHAMNDAAAAYQTAIRWKVSGEDAYAEKSIEILNAWASVCDTITGNSNIALGAGIYGFQFANAAELMRDYEGWKASDFEAFQEWMLEVFYPVSRAFLDTHWNTCISHYWANWDLANLANVMSIGVLTDSVEIYNYALNYLIKGEGNGNLNKAIYYIHENGLGQLQESGRDQGHSLLCIGFIGDICEMAWKQGYDLYGYDDNRFLKGAEYSAKYNVAYLDVPFEPYNNCDDVNHTGISDHGRGEGRPIWEKVYNHYVKRKGLAAPYVEMAARTQRPEGGGGDYGPNSGGFDNLGFGTLLYSLEDQ